ncbi:unnamed protein product, partial [Durusdinium trenchii]
MQCREGVNIPSKLSELEGEPAAFRSSRAFAMMLPHCVQVIRLNFKSVAARTPVSATECCTQLAQMGQVASPHRPQASWSFDDVGIPSFEEQRKHMSLAATVPPVRLGRWLLGLLRFLAVVLRPIWDLPLVVTVSHREKLGLVQQETLGLGIAEDAVRRLLTRLRPAVLFARTGLQASPHAVASQCATRFKLYTERSIQTEAVAQARQTLHSVLQVAERAMEVLALLSLLQEQKSAYRVLRSSLLKEDLLQTLQRTSFGKLVESDEALDPAVQLCTAFLMESGLTTPSVDLEAPVPVAPVARPLTAPREYPRFRGASAGLCRDLEEQCPKIFQRLDLSVVNARLGQTPATPLAAATLAKVDESCLELLHRYAQCVSVNSPEEHWASLTETLRHAVQEDPQRAAEVCVQKLQQLQLSAARLTSDTLPTVEARARQVLEALLGAMSQSRWQPEDQVLATQSLVEQLLTRT